MSTSASHHPGSGAGHVWTSSAAASAAAEATRSGATVWGLEPVQLHDRFWAARGVQVVRRGENAFLEGDAELYLLTEPQIMLLFRTAPLVDTLNWLKPRMMLLRVHDTHDHGYQERVIADSNDRFVRFEREYGTVFDRMARIALTTDTELARQWQEATDGRSGWRALRREVDQMDRTTVSIEGSVYDRRSPEETAPFMRELVQTWARPDVTVQRARRTTGAAEVTAWRDQDVQVPESVRFVGPVWIGAGRRLKPEMRVVGPAVIWDDPAVRPQVEEIDWREMEPAELEFSDVHVRRMSSFQRGSKRLLDLLLATAALLATLPFYPLVMLAIWLEDGRPFFFAHRRETLGGREFPCLKFRTMRKDAEQIKARLQAENQADGPQFFIEHDPRISRVGRFLRKVNIDELPQFLNVLVGHMSIVGPRPSPHKENQFCPAWREARLSVRPGITGMWQVYRSRQDGLDFQEWIRYDLYYVEHVSWRLDIKLIWLTFAQIVGLKKKRGA